MCSLNDKTDYLFPSSLLPAWCYVTLFVLVVVPFATNPLIYVVSNQNYRRWTVDIMMTAQRLIHPSTYLEPTLTPCAAAGGPGGWPLPTLRVHPATANIQTPSNTTSITWELEENIVQLSLCFFQYVAIMSVLNLCNCERDTYLLV